MTDQPARRTNEEIEALKKSWLNDPCWDIETEPGFEFHKDELYTFRERQESEWDAERAEREDAYVTLVREQTGVIDFDVAGALHTFTSIENAVERQDKYIGQFASITEQVKIELAQTQIRATLLQAAQLKRIADALEKMSDGDNLVGIKV